MNIIDLNGKVIDIENLDLAFQQADDYRHYRHSNSAFAELDNRLQAYWEDLYQKLLQIKIQQL